MRHQSMFDESEIALLRQRYVNYFGQAPTHAHATLDLESRLGIQIPYDMRRISEFFHGGMLGSIVHNAMVSDSPATNIVDATQHLRSTMGLPHRMLVLAEPAESLVLLDTESDRVIWCDNYDIPWHNNYQEMQGEPIIWHSYSEFFEYLLDQEYEEHIVPVEATV